jgi:hypothetical protein
MNEAEWFVCTDSELMLDHLGSEASNRKLRLYACALGYEEWQRMIDERSRDAIVVAERFADGLADSEELIFAFNAAQEAWKQIVLIRGGRHGKGIKSGKGSSVAKRIAGLARNAANPKWDIRMARQDAWRQELARKCGSAHYLREIFGNPFRPTVIEPNMLSSNDGIAIKLARAIYDEYAFDRLPILADALEEAGCTDTDILNHCRQPGDHVRGCWVVDLLLGRS